VVTKKDKHLAAAQKYLERGSFEKALAMFQQAVKEDPKDTRTWLRMAEVYVRLGQNDKATEVYQKTVDLYVEQGFFQRAVAVYKNIIKLSPDFVDARIKLAEVFRQLGLLSDAVQQLEHAASLFQKTNNVPQALSALKQIIELNPEQPNSRIRYAEIASQAGAIKEAVAEFAEAARLLKAQGRVEEFLRVAERLLHYQPDNCDVAVEVAARYLEQNNARAALTRIKPIFEAKQRDPAILDLLARIFEQLGQPHKTLPVLKELARVYSESGRIMERNQVIQRVLSMDPNDQEMHELMGRAHAAIITPVSASRLVTPGPQPGPIPTLTPLPLSSPKRPGTITFSEMEVPPALRNKYVSPDPAPAASMSERLSIASDMVEKKEDDPEVKRILAESDVFVKYGLVERAADHLRRVFERVPTHQGAHERLAAVLVQLDRKAEAVAEYEVLAQQCLHSNPSNASNYARKALELNPSAKRALEVIGMLEGSLPVPSSEKNEMSSSEELHMGTPEPDIIESEEIELLGETALETDEFGKNADAAVAQEPVSDAYADVVFESAKKTSGSPVDSFANEPTDGGPTQIVEGIGSSGVLEVEAQYDTKSGDKDDGIADDLEQVDFFMDQGLLAEALALLDELESRASGNRLLTNRRMKLNLLLQEVSQGAVPSQVHGELTVPTNDPNRMGAVKGPGEHDFDTHADLGIMEKTMERYQAAIDHFKVLLNDSKREVFAMTMIGECHEALGDSAKAIRCYQDALKRPTATTQEATQLYFQLGCVFYNLGDQSEALYYFERVSKRDANFRDIQRRLAELKSRATAR
jgi:tetratricopeptide (TPR) repeat protein